MDWDCIYQTRKGSLEPDILTVHLLSRGSQPVYYPHSYLITLNSVRTSNHMFKILLTALTRAEIKGEEVPFLEDRL